MTKLETAIKKMEDTFNETVQFGSCDSYPRFEMLQLIKRTLRGEEFKPMDKHQWKLYVDEKGADEAAEKLSNAAKELIEIIENSPLKEIRGKYMFGLTINFVV